MCFNLPLFFLDKINYAAIRGDFLRHVQFKTKHFISGGYYTMALFGFGFNEHQAILKSLNKSQAVIHFDPSGNILDANDNFLTAIGYTLDEIKGKHHSMFVEPA